jgi:hypothetical protein
MKSFWIFADFVTSSLNVFDDGAELLVSVFWTLSIIIVRR